MLCLFYFCSLFVLNFFPLNIEKDFFFFLIFCFNFRSVLIVLNSFLLNINELSETK